ncbi:hypothetical protein LIER_32650 [Lithospermum erythrorhizon]|uniref:Uncharacterized protein n=1 Tax=Lithospermum erythrorhizon TaxID=34254 RepID=A0AAV3RVS4_LITER
MKKGYLLSKGRNSRKENVLQQKENAGQSMLLVLTPKKHWWRLSSRSATQGEPLKEISMKCSKKTDVARYLQCEETSEDTNKENSTTQ